MPLYGSGTNGAPVALQPGDVHRIFDAETLEAGQASQAVARAIGPTGEAGITFTVSFEESPTAVVKIQGSNEDADGQYQDLHTSTDKQLDSYTDSGRWKFYRALLVSQSAGGKLTVISQR